MNSDKTTIDSILAGFKDSIEKRLPIGAGMWVDYALRLNVLVESVDDQIAEIEAQMAELEAEEIGNGETAAAAKRVAKGKVDYRTYLKLSAKRKRIQEFIRLAKKKAEVIKNHKDF